MIKANVPQSNYARKELDSGRPVTIKPTKLESNKKLNPLKNIYTKNQLAKYETKSQ